MPKILIVEDEEAVRLMAGFALGRAGFQVDEAEDSVSADKALSTSQPDLLLVDWMLPGISGIDWIKRLKREETTKKLPVIMLTARAQESDKIYGLDSGADDYVTKPFSPRELVSRINAVLRRCQTDKKEEYTSGDLILNPEAHSVTAGSKELDMGPTEFRLLKFFMSHPNRVYSREQLLDFVWGRSHFVEERTVDVHVLRLRKSLSPHGYDGLIQTVRGVGYRFSDKTG
ncbi:MAG TPA: phosphate regulon transcriptional regulatory protein PhoB [Gammaproteobacteria bacterium]|nr:phosphate regulon transcriptional regulatory protein PhoB [Gammaproteobacteria bacterium]